MKMIKKMISLTLVAFILILALPPMQVHAAYKLPFDTLSRSVYMVNTDTGTVVYEKNAHDKIYPASLTKIMSVVIALENVADLEGTIVTAPSYVYDEFYGLNVSTADVRQGEDVRMIDLLYAMMLPSACEASSIVADYVADGSITEFAEMMNKKAVELGALDTTFKNAHGLFDEEQQTTAYDMYLIAKYAMSLPMFEKIATATSYEMPVTNKHPEPRIITHTNAMLSKTRGGTNYYQYSKGIKTGSLPEVGKNLVSMASKDGYNYMLVTMQSADLDANGVKQQGHYIDARKLYDWAFDSFKQQTVLKTDEMIDETSIKLCSEQDYVPLFSDRDVTALLPTDVDITSIQKIKTIQKDVSAPIAKGAVLGQMELKLNDEVIAIVNLITATELKRSPILYGLDVTLRFLSTTPAKVMLSLLGLLFIGYLILSARYRKIKRLAAARNRFNTRG